MRNFAREIRLVFRALRRSPGFFVVAALTLALGIGATTAIFSVVNGVLLAPLPYPHSERIVQLLQINPGGQPGQNIADPNFLDWRAQSRSFGALAEVSHAFSVSVTGPSVPVRAVNAMASTDFFSVIGVAPVAGRFFVPADQRVGAAPTVVVGEEFATRNFGGARAAVGRVITFDGTSYTIIGVAPRTLVYPVSAELWSAAGIAAPAPSRTAHNWMVIGRLAPDATVERAAAEISRISRRMKLQYGDATDMSDATVMSLHDRVVGKSRQMLLVLLGASAFLLLIACANVVNLLVARMIGRGGELSLRLALGASRGRLVQQFLAEALVLALSGGLAGVFLAWVGVHALLSLNAGRLPRADAVHLSLPVLAFALLLSLSAAVAMGMLTAWRATRAELRAAMAESQRSVAGGRAGIRQSLVVVQVALTLVLLVGAGLLGRSLIHLFQVDPGFRVRNELLIDVPLATAGDSLEQLQNLQFYETLQERLAHVPGVSDVGVVSAFPIGGLGAPEGTFLIVNSPVLHLQGSDLEQLFHGPSRTGEADYRVASASYFGAMGIPVLRGRNFTEADAVDGPPVAVISATLARTRWPGQNPIGQYIEFGNMDGDMRPLTVVGVVGDVRDASLASPARPIIYSNYRQRRGRLGEMIVAVSGGGDVAAVTASARRILGELRPDLPPVFTSAQAAIQNSVSDRRFSLVLVGVFSAAALLLASLGVYSVLAYLVTQRRQEFSVRVALGAESRNVIALVMRQGVVFALMGIGLGTIAALGLTRLLSGMLYDVSPTDPVAFGAVALLLACIALLASFVPARRAAKVDPMNVLRGG
jgi:predicted permease